MGLTRRAGLSDGIEFQQAAARDRFEADLPRRPGSSRRPAGRSHCHGAICPGVDHLIFFASVLNGGEPRAPDLGAGRRGATDRENRSLFYPVHAPDSSGRCPPRRFEIDLDEPGDPARSDASQPPDDIRTSNGRVDETAAQRLSTSPHLSVRAVTPAIWMFGPVRSAAAQSREHGQVVGRAELCLRTRPCATYRPALTAIARLRVT